MPLLGDPPIDPRGATMQTISRNIWTWWTGRAWPVVRNPLTRAFRTFVDTAIGVYLAGLVASPMFADLADLTLLESAAAAGVVAVLSLTKNMLEEWRQVSYNRG